MFPEPTLLDYIIFISLDYDKLFTNPNQTIQYFNDNLEGFNLNWIQIQL